MPPITALLHTKNDALRLGRALETLLPCAEFLIADHASTDTTLRVARDYGARIVTADDRSSPEDLLSHASHNWILSLQPSESLTEALQATLYEWSLLPEPTPTGSSAFSLHITERFLREFENRQSIEARENSASRRPRSMPETRLVPRTWRSWKGFHPAHQSSATPLEGELLRFDFP